MNRTSLWFYCFHTDLNEIRPFLPQILDGMFLLNYLNPVVVNFMDMITELLSAEFFKLMNEVENEDLVFTLETIVDKFGEEMAPYAIRLCQNLVM